MTLVEYITQVGDAQAAKHFLVKPRTAQSWRLKKRLPRAEKARFIVQRTNGKITLGEIFGESRA